MENKNSIKTLQNNETPVNIYDDNNIPKEDLPSKDIIPDEVPRKDGPGGESGIN